MSEAINKILETIDNIKPSKTKVKVKLISRPYSYRLVEAICIAQGLTYTQTHTHDDKKKRFTIFEVGATSSFEEDIVSIVKQVNVAARKDEKISIGRNNIADKIIKELGVELPEKEKPVKVKKEKAPKAEKKVENIKSKKAPAKKATAKKATAKKAPAKKAPAKKAS